MKEQFDTIYDSIVNGQRKQAVEQMLKLDTQDIPDLLDYIAQELDQAHVALDAAKSYFRLAHEILTNRIKP